jgi:hypothetical protein
VEGAVTFECVVLTAASAILGVLLYRAMPKPMPGERRTLRWIGALVGLLGLLS